MNRMMKNKNRLFAYLFGTFLLAGCGETEITHIGDPGEGALANDPNRREVVLGFQNNLALKQTGTRADAIATAAENTISTLDIYAFSSDSEDGPYTYQERFYYREDGSTLAGTGVTKIVVATAGDKLLATLRPQKGLYTKFYCIANQTKLLKADGTEYNLFTPLKQEAPGTGANRVTAAGAPTETEFTALTTPMLTTTDVMNTPLPMVGSYSPALDLRDISMGSRTRINMSLSRIVSRFDIENDAKKSHLTITHLAMGNGRKGVSFFPVVPVESSPFDPATDLITYADRDFAATGVTLPNEGTVTGAFYSYPSPIEDNGYLIIKGKYALNQTDTPVDVSYKVDFTQVMNGTGGQIEVKENHRYTVQITKADPFKVDINLTVSDWTDGGELDDYLPENEVMIDAAGIAEGTDVTFDAPSKTATVKATATGNYLTIPMTCNAEVECKVVYAAAGSEWLKVELTPNPAVRATGSASYTCTVKKNDSYPGILFPDAKIVLSSKAGREEQAITVKREFEVPEVTGGTSDPAGANSYAPGSESPAITGTLKMKKTADDSKPTMQLSVKAMGGSKLVGLPKWLTADKTEGYDAETVTYTLTMDSAGEGFPTDLLPATGVETFEVQNLSDATKKVIVTVDVTETTTP